MLSMWFREVSLAGRSFEKLLYGVADKKCCWKPGRRFAGSANGESLLLAGIMSSGKFRILIFIKDL